MQARYYDPVIGRFYSNDPVGVLGHISTGSIQGFNRYNYAYNNPYKYTDPDGEHPALIRAGKEGYRLGTYINMGLSLVIQATTGSDSLGELIYDIVNSEEATDGVSDRSDGDGNSDEVDGLVEELDGM